MTEKNQFYVLVDFPDFLIPWWDRFYEKRDMALVLLLGKDTVDIEEINRRWRMMNKDTCPQELDRFLARSVRKGLIHQENDLRYRIADFHTRFDIWAMFEGWQDIPADLRETLNQLELNHYQSECLSQIEHLKQGKSRDTSKRWPEYLLLHEAETLIDKVDRIYLWPCNCRSMMARCRKPVITCLRFSNNRGIGWEISKSKAKEVMREANRKGLMQSGEISITPDGRIGGTICNCCADCCFPHLLAERLQVEKLWPLTRYIAQVDEDRCTGCGRCVRRCPFHAFTIKKPAKSSHEPISRSETEQSPVDFDSDLCRGCGLCSTGCKEEAITMIKLKGLVGISDKIFA